jgi:hypothetical protein
MRAEILKARTLEATEEARRQSAEQMRRSF